MSSLFTLLLDTLFPPHEETLLVRRLRDTDVLFQYHPHPVRDVIALSSFSTPPIRALIHEAKFRKNTQAHKLLSLLIAQYHTEHYADTAHIYVPIPLSPQRLRDRGYNQVREVLTALQYHHPHVRIDDTLLIRTRNTKPQTDLARAQRLHNLTDAFSVVDSARVQDAHLIILDDVVTTGATRASAREALLPHHPSSITLMALAH